MLNITDQSMPSRDSILTCNLFHSASEKLPTQAQVGDVIRFHRLKVCLPVCPESQSLFIFPLFFSYIIYPTPFLCAISTSTPINFVHTVWMSLPIVILRIPFESPLFLLILYFPSSRLALSFFCISFYFFSLLLLVC